MARAELYNMLSLDRWARIMGVNPAHFSGAASGSVMPVGGACSDIWWQYSWQSGDRVAREDLARAIATAEKEISEALGYYPAPQFITEEVHPYPRHHRRDLFGTGVNIRGMQKSLIPKWGKIIDASVRAVTIMADSTAIVFTDADGDGYNETATITIAHGGITTDPREIKVYVEDHAGAQIWEIRDPRSVTISGANAIIVFWAWQLIDPDLWETLTTDAGASALELTDAIYLSAVDVYREYRDTTDNSALFYWEPEDWLLSPLNCPVCSGTGCPTCELTTQDGCLTIRDAVNGIVVPTAATYDEDDARWERDEWTECREPDQVKIWYYAGEIDERYLRSEVIDPLSHYWAETIAWMATTRLERPFCACANVIALAKNLRVDMSRADNQAPNFLINDQTLRNPFGMMKGEVNAWRRVFKNVDRRTKVAVI